MFLGLTARRFYKSFGAKGLIKHRSFTFTFTRTFYYLLFCLSRNRVQFDSYAICENIKEFKVIYGRVAWVWGGFLLDVN
jgi:hypothetical protein